MTAFPGDHQRYGFSSQLVHGGASHVSLIVPSPPVEASAVIVPPPAPSYTLAPDVGPLTLGQQALDACLGALTGRVGGVVVTSAFTTGTHHVLELVTPAGTLIALERAERAGARRATHVRVRRDPS